MNTPNDGGPAFPQTNDAWCGPCPSGMTLRDYFAGKAMQGELSTFTSYEMISACVKEARSNGMTSIQLVATRSYEMADAMLAARERKET